MKMTRSFALIALFWLVTLADGLAAQVWRNDAPGAVIKRLDIYQSADPVQLPTATPSEGYVDITFQNDVRSVGNILYRVNSSTNPLFLQAVTPRYSTFTVYYCAPPPAQPDPTVVINQVCDGIALRTEGNQLCVGYFQYGTLVNIVATVAELGCFVGDAILQIPKLSKRDILARYSKEQLIDILSGIRPVGPIGPICLSCPPWPDYRKDIAQKLPSLKVRKFRIEVQEVR